MLVLVTTWETGILALLRIHEMMYVLARSLMCLQRRQFPDALTRMAAREQLA